jgi:hypothetical protein
MGSLLIFTAQVAKRKKNPKNTYGEEYAEILRVVGAQLIGGRCSGIFSSVGFFLHIVVARRYALLSL